MKTLQELLVGVRYSRLSGPENPRIEKLCTEPGNVVQDDAFVALIGYGKDRHQDIPQVIAQGAVAVVCQTLPEKLRDQVSYVLVEDTYEAVGAMAANYYGHPGREMKIVGVTGTNGKTSTVTLLHQLFRKLGHKAGLLSTVVNKVNDLEIATNKTTPVAIDLYRLLRQMADAGCEYCFMEASSHGIFQKRLISVDFSGAVFTNISIDHLDYHGTFEEYFRVKKSFLDAIPASGFVIANLDDPRTAAITANCKASVKTFSAKRSAADYFGEVVQDSIEGLVVEIEGTEVRSRLRGGFNAYNLLGVFAVAVAMGVEEAKVLEMLPYLTPVEGRFDLIRSSKGILGVVDFAHTPDALLNLYRALTRLKNNRLISVMGAGGEKYREKRPDMARIAHENSDVLILTMDNPRWENPTQIFDDLLSGLGPAPANTYVIQDREQAIQKACTLANPGDIILVAGKGHEKIQEIKGVEHPFDDKLVLGGLLAT